MKIQGSGRVYTRSAIGAFLQLGELGSFPPAFPKRSSHQQHDRRSFCSSTSLSHVPALRKGHFQHRPQNRFIIIIILIIATIIVTFTVVTVIITTVVIIIILILTPITTVLVIATHHRQQPGLPASLPLALLLALSGTGTSTSTIIMSTITCIIIIIISMSSAPSSHLPYRRPYRHVH